MTEMKSRVPVTVFHIAGHINSDDSAQLQSRIHQAYDDGARNVLLDLSEVTHVSSAGLRVFADILNLLRAETPGGSRHTLRRIKSDADAFKSRHFKLLNPCDQVLRVLTLTGLNIFLEIHTDLNEAVNSF